MVIRFLAPALVAGGFTMILFWVMTLLIEIEEIEIHPDPLAIVALVTVRQDHPPRPKVRTTPERPPVPNQPILPRITTTTPGDAGPWNLRDPIHVDPVPRDGSARIPLEPADGDAVPLVRGAPRYPEHALARGIEGRVLIESRSALRAPFATRTSSPPNRAISSKNLPSRPCVNGVTTRRSSGDARSNARA